MSADIVSSAGSEDPNLPAEKAKTKLVKVVPAVPTRANLDSDTRKILGEIEQLNGGLENNRATLNRLAEDTLTRALRAGQLLIDLKSKYGKHGQWAKFIENCLPGISSRTITRYMRLYRRRGLLKSVTVTDLTSCYRLLTKPQKPKAQAQGAPRTEDAGPHTEPDKPVAHKGAQSHTNGAAETTGSLNISSNDAVETFLASAWTCRGGNEGKLELLGRLIDLANEWKDQLVRAGAMGAHEDEARTGEPTSKETTAHSAEAGEADDADIALKDYLDAQWANCRSDLQRERFTEVLMHMGKRCKERLGWQL